MIGSETYKNIEFTLLWHDPCWFVAEKQNRSNRNEIYD